jgi:hypothetical protein
MPISTGSIYSQMMGSAVKMAESERGIGSYLPTVAKIETQIKRGREDLTEDIRRIGMRLKERESLRKERLSLVGSLYKIGKTAEINLENQKYLESGARAMDIDMPKMTVWQKFKTALMGPEVEELYGNKNIPGKYLMSLGRIYETDPEQGGKYKEFLEDWQKTDDTLKRATGLNYEKYYNPSYNPELIMGGRQQFGNTPTGLDYLFGNRRR